MRKATTGAITFGVVAPAAAAAVIGWVHHHVAAAERRAISARADAPAAEALVVLGAEAWPDGPSGLLRRRLDRAIVLWTSGAAPLIAISGGWDGRVDEIDVMRDYLRANGVPGRAIRDLRPGNTTRDSLSAARAAGYRRVVVVSCGFHAHRIESEARRQRLEARVLAPAPLVGSEATRIENGWRRTETLASIWYALPPGLTVALDTGPGSLRHTLPSLLTTPSR